jgi:mono/diheme cytochrome c family protein
MEKKLFLMIIFALGLASCSQADEALPGGMGMGRSGDMMARHMAQVPSEYRNVSNPIEVDEASLQRGEELYQTNCASCHGDGGMGDGPAGTALDPSPAPIAHTSQMLGDDYLFWRISDGGAFSPFDSTMPAWGPILDENEIWDVINYTHALGSGEALPQQRMGGERYDPADEAQRLADMLDQAVAQDLITEEQAQTFTRVHDAVDTYRNANPDFQSGGGMLDIEAQLLSALVSAREITQQDADTFVAVRDRLIETGLMQ